MFGYAAVFFALLALAACNPQPRMGMVVDPATGLQYGATVERTLAVDASQFGDRRFKVRARNASGDPALDMRSLIGRIEDAYAAKGFQPSQGDDFAILLDVVVEYSGQISTNMSKEYAFLGAAAGGIAGYRSSAEAGTAIGAVTGATLGYIIGSYDTQDTYIVIAKVTMGLREAAESGKRSITFSRSPGRDPELEEERRARERAFKPWNRTWESRVAVYAGGRSTPQHRIADQVRQRLASIVSDMI
jgi:hypothetical protein